MKKYKVKKVVKKYDPGTKSITGIQNTKSKYPIDTDSSANGANLLSQDQIQDQAQKNPKAPAMGGLGDKAGGVVGFAQTVGQNFKQASQISNSNAQDAAALSDSNPYKKGAGGTAIATGAVKGAQAGAAFGPYGAIIGGAVGALSGVPVGIANAKKRDEFKNYHDAKVKQDTYTDYYSKDGKYDNLNYKKGTKSVSKYPGGTKKVNTYKKVDKVSNNDGRGEGIAWSSKEPNVVRRIPAIPSTTRDVPKDQVVTKRKDMQSVNGGTKEQQAAKKADLIARGYTNIPGTYNYQLTPKTDFVESNKAEDYLKANPSAYYADPEKHLDYSKTQSTPYMTAYKKGTKYKTAKGNIEFEGGEPIFSPKKKDGTRDLLYFDKDGPKHSEGGIPGNVIPKSKYKLAKGSKVLSTPADSPVDIVEGSAIVTAKGNKGTEAVKAHLAGDTKKVEAIISKMPTDKKYKAVDGKKKVIKGATHSTTQAESHKNMSYMLKGLSPEEGEAFKKHKQSFEDHQAILSKAHQKAGHDLNAKEQEDALTAHNKANGTNYSVKSYNDSVNGLDSIAKSKGVDINLRGDKEGRTGADQTGMYGWRNATAQFGYNESTPENINDSLQKGPGPDKGAIPPPPVNAPAGATEDAGPGVPNRFGGAGVRASDINNMAQGLSQPDTTKYKRVGAVPYSYHDLSDPSRRRSNWAQKAQMTNATNLSGGSASNVRANANAAIAANANRQQDINANELGRFDSIKNQNAQNQQNVNYANTDISNKEIDANDQNRQATRDQLQTGLVGFDENNYRNRVDSEQKYYDTENNNIEKKKLNLLKGYVPNYEADKNFNVNYKKANGAKAVKYKKKKS